MTHATALAGVPEVRGEYVTLGDREFYCIDAYDEIPPFFMTLVGASDLWLFISSTGGMTAGRRDASRAVFPYYTDDKVAESAGRTGGLLLVRTPGPEGAVICWEPFTSEPRDATTTDRRLYKDVLGTTLVFEEARRDLGLRARVSWSTGREFGIVRTTELASLSPGAVEVEVLDGIVNVLPAGVEVGVQSTLSNLLDAYKRTEADPATGLAMMWLSSRLTDLAEPSESLQANVAWQVGLESPDLLLCTHQVRAFRTGRPIAPELDVRGERGAYLVHHRRTLAAGESVSWRIVADAGLDAADVVQLDEFLRDPDRLDLLLSEDVVSTRTALEVIVGAADGFQSTGERTASAHHAANVLFNVMRGGIPVEGYGVEREAFAGFLRVRSPRTFARHPGLPVDVPVRLSSPELISWAEGTGDRDLVRLAYEFIPLTFSRRHGDPSRPWNQFTIPAQKAGVAPVVGYQGNWRDIFQNWEALAWSYPEFTESMIAVFLDATTVDGYNPYRVSLDGIDWETPEPDNPWSNIGYWSDHQIVYLLRLLETSQRFHPGRLVGWLGRDLFTCADVPYRIADYDSILADPFDTIAFDEARADEVERRTRTEGSDGRLVHDRDGSLTHVTLAEKLLLLSLTKMANLVPDGGIWMHTQRPEWNDANNALVGRGLSVVTLAQLRRFVHVMRDLIDEDVIVSAELAGLASEVTSVLADHAAGLAEGFDDVGRRAVVDALGAAGSRYREKAYRGLGEARVPIQAGAVHELLDLMLDYVDASLLANRRDDDLFHSYNLLALSPGQAAVRRLPEMLEGQVAVLSSGLLDVEQSRALLRALRASRLYRPDQHAYLLYPDKDVPGFLARNRFEEREAESCPLVEALVSRGDRRLVTRDIVGAYHFVASIRNERDVVSVLDELSGDPEWQAAVERDRAAMLELFESVFRHSEFTGRSGTFFAYEGLGSVYWHMVAKLLLAVQEVTERAVTAGADARAIADLEAAYEDIRTGLGYCKTPDAYGAFPTDPYSHTPGGKGARQPGMTGQVKEELLTRWGELGLRVEDGRIVLRPFLLRPTEWRADASDFVFYDVRGECVTRTLPRESLAFTFCQVPFVLTRGPALQATVRWSDGRRTVVDGPLLDEEASQAIFGRTGQVDEVTVVVPSP